MRLCEDVRRQSAEGGRVPLATVAPDDASDTPEPSARNRTEYATRRVKRAVIDPSLAFNELNAAQACALVKVKSNLRGWLGSRIAKGPYRLDARISPQVNYRGQKGDICCQDSD